jgi:hypothetical protein
MLKHKEKRNTNGCRPTSITVEVANSLFKSTVSSNSDKEFFPVKTKHIVYVS